jgi:hypothetical protein
MRSHWILTSCPARYCWQYSNCWTWGLGWVARKFPGYGGIGRLLVQHFCLRICTLRCLLDLKCNVQLDLYNRMLIADSNCLVYLQRWYDLAHDGALWDDLDLSKYQVCARRATLVLISTQRNISEVSGIYHDAVLDPNIWLLRQR